MKTIFKFPIDKSIMHVELPKDAKFIYAQVQNGMPQMWFELDTEREKTTRTFIIHPTGGEIAENHLHLWTCLSQFQNFVLHLYEEVK